MSLGFIPHDTAASSPVGLANPRQAQRALLRSASVLGLRLHPAVEVGAGAGASSLTNNERYSFRADDAPQGNCGYFDVRRRLWLSRPGSPFLVGILSYWSLEMTVTLTAKWPRQPTGKQAMWKVVQKDTVAGAGPSRKNNPTLRLSMVLLLLILVLLPVTPVDAQRDSADCRSMISRASNQRESVELQHSKYRRNRHSKNRRNRNRIRRQLEKEIQSLKQRTELSKEDKGRRLERLQEQLQQYQRAKVDPPADKSVRQTSSAKVGNRRWRPGILGEKKGENAGHGNSRPERRYGDGRVVRYPIERVMSRRRHGVSSYGDKSKGLSVRWEMERRRKAALLERDPWYYHATLAEMDFLKYQQAYTDLAIQRQGICTATPGRCGILSSAIHSRENYLASDSDEGFLFDLEGCRKGLVDICRRTERSETHPASESAVYIFPTDGEAAVHSRENYLASDFDEGFVFDLDGCDHECCIFDISRYCDGARTSNNKSAVELTHLDSGYYVHVPSCTQADQPSSASTSDAEAAVHSRENHPASDSDEGFVFDTDGCSHADGAAEEEEPSADASQDEQMLRIKVRQGKKCSRTFTLCNSGRIADLQREIHVWSKVPPDEQRLFRNGISLAPELGLSNLWDGICVTLEKGLQGGSGFKAGWGSLRSGEKKKRGRKKSAQRAAARRKAVAASERFYNETKRMMESRERPNEEFNYGEFEEYMATEADSEDIQEAEKEEEEYKKEIEEYKVPLYGTLSPIVKADESVRFMSINVNSLSMWKRFNYKAERLKWSLKNYQVDSMGLQEVCVNWRNFRCRLHNTLRYGGDPMRSVASHNTLETKNTGDTQRGGTGTVVNGLMAKYVRDSGVDHTGLGRWSWFKLEGEPGHRTRVVTAYAPTGSKSSGLSTYYKQSDRYIKKNGLNSTPKKMFRDDLCAVLKQWRLQGDRIVLMMDANDNVLNGHIAKALAKDGIELKEAVHAQTPGYGPKTHFRGSQSIDGIWYTPDLELMGASYLPFDADMGDHRPVMADFTEQSLLGVNLPNIVPPDGRRLNCKIERIRTRYIEDLEAKFERHNILERLKKISKEASFPISAEAAEAWKRLTSR